MLQNHNFYFCQFEAKNEISYFDLSYLWQTFFSVSWWLFYCVYYILNFCDQTWKSFSFISPVSVCSVASVVSGPLRPYGLQPARLLCPWGFSRKDFWSGLPFPSSGDLPDSGAEPKSPGSSALQADSLPWSPWGSPSPPLALSKTFCQRDKSDRV